MPDAPHRDFVALLAGFPAVSLAEMDGVRLMNRTDTKYVTDESVLVAVLADAREAGYRVLEVEGERISAYDSLYFDTGELKMFTDHRNRRVPRQKVRTRLYVSSGTAFLEVKRKRNNGRTKKKRTAVPAASFPDFRTDPAACHFLAEKSAYTADCLSPSLETVFRRITLVNPAMTERLTIDTCLAFANPRTGRAASLGRGVVIELKQDGRAASAIKRILLDRRVKPLRMSKYCVGVTLTDPAARANRFKLKIRTIEKTIQDKLW